VKLASLFLFLILSIGSLEAQSIYWKEDRKLTWEDYKGDPPLTRTAARTYVGFSFNVISLDPITNIGIYQVKSFFVSDSSWVQPGLWHRTDLLEHEQLHFDLAELYATQIRNLIVGKTPSEAKSIYKVMLPQYRQRQRDYDFETRHGIKEIEQKHWNQMISEELLLNQ